MNKIGRAKQKESIYNNFSGGQPPEMLFNNLIWLTTKEAAFFLRKSVNAIHQLVSKGKLRARKYGGRLYFNKDELNHLLETSQFKGGF